MTSSVLGRYTPYNSFIHRLDARVKIIAMILMMIAIFMGYSTKDGRTLWTTTFIVGGILTVLVIVFMLISHVSILNLFKSLKVMWFLVVFLLLINILIPPVNGDKTWFIPGTDGFPIYYDSILLSLKIVLRLVLMVAVTMILTATTTPLDLTYALEWFMTPLKIIRFPVHAIAMTISIALRFIPTLLDETERIMKAQSSRGVDFNKGKISSRFKAIISLIIPLFVSAFQRSEELANAMEARGYDPQAKRTRFRKLKFHFKDIIGFLVPSSICAAILYLSITNFDIIYAIFHIVTK